VEQLEFVERNFAFQEYYMTTTLMLSGIQWVKQYTQEDFIGRLEQAFYLKEGVTLTEFVRVDPVNRVVVWRGFYTSASPIASPYYEFAMHFTEDYKIR
jgi:glycine cleavage system aminomethyltransferase T